MALIVDKMDNTELTEIHSSSTNTPKKDEISSIQIRVADEQTTDVSRFNAVVQHFVIKNVKL